MYNSCHFLTAWLGTQQQLLVGKQLLASFTQHRGELVLGFADTEGEVWWRSQLEGSELGGAFVQTALHYNRARNNSVDIFPAMLGQWVRAVQVTRGDRSISLVLAESMLATQPSFLLLLRLHGPKGNAVLFSFDENEYGAKYASLENWATSLSWVGQETFLKRGEQLLHEPPLALQAELPTAEEELHASSPATQRWLATLGREGKFWLTEQGYETASERYQQTLLLTLWQAVQQAIAGGPFYLCAKDHNLYLSLLPFGDLRASYEQASQALDAYLKARLGAFGLEKERHRLTAAVLQRIKQTENYLAKTRTRLHHLQGERSPEELGHLLMAAAHTITTANHEQLVTIPDWYGGEDASITIKLKAGQSAQAHAQQLYAKSKNRKRELEHLVHHLEVKEALWLELNQQVEALGQIDNLKELRLWAKEHGLFRATKSGAELAPSLPYKQFEYAGYQIRVGKNAAANDQLTLKFAHKDDLWLHARGVPGSHVVIKAKAGQEVPVAVVNHAAALAVWYSKARNQPMCPVIVTPKKWVTKPKGAAPGSVAVAREEVVFANAVKPEGDAE